MRVRGERGDGDHVGCQLDEQVDRAPCGVRGSVGHDDELPDGEPGEPDGRCRYEPGDPVGGDVSPAGNECRERTDAGEAAGAQTPGSQGKRQEHLYNQEHRGGPHTDLAEVDGER